MQASAAQRIGFIRRLMNRSMQAAVPPERHKLYLNHLVDADSAAVEALRLTGSKLVGYDTAFPSRLSVGIGIGIGIRTTARDLSRVRVYASVRRLP